MKIAFSDDAFETFERFIGEMPGYVAQITTTTGKTFDAVLIGTEPATESTQSDTLTYRDYDESSHDDTAGPVQHLELDELEEVLIY